MPPNKDLFHLPERNKFYCFQEDKIHGFKVLDHKKQDLYEVLAKTVATRSHYRVRRIMDNVAIASIDQGQMASTYTMKDEGQNLLATIKILSPDEIKLEIGSNLYEGKSVVRGKQFEFRSKNNSLVLAIDKKLISLSDKYQVSFIENFPALVAALLPVIIDDYFHSGLSV